MSLKDRHGPTGPIFKIQPDCKPPEHANAGGTPGRWAEVFKAFDKLEPGKWLGVEVLNASEANRLASSLNGHAAVYLRDNPDAGWRLKTTSRAMPNGHSWFSAQKRLTTES